MEPRYHSIFSLLFIILTFSNCYLYSKDNENERENQYMGIHDNLPEMFFAPIRYTKSSISYYLEHTYNDKRYGQRFLAFNFSHVSDFLRYISENKQPRRYIAKVLKLFILKMHSVVYINSAAFFDLLEQLPMILQPHFDKIKEKKETLSNIRYCLYDFLMNNFDDLKENPEWALNTLSNRIYNFTSDRDNNQSYDFTTRELRYVVTQFLQIALSKLIWSSVDQYESWKLLKDISYKLEHLFNLNIIDLDGLDECIWLLIHRYSYFLQLQGSELTEECYRRIANDLKIEKAALWTLEEREPFIATKLNHLQQALINSEVRAQALSAGLIADQLTT